MEKSNIIISIIIVLCIAAAVTAYGLTNNDDAIFSDLANMGSSDSGDDGIGDSSGGSSNGASSSGGSGSGSSRGGSGGGSGSGGGGDSKGITQAGAKEIAQKHISQAGCTAGVPYLRGNEWKVPVYDSHGNQVDTISVNRYTGAVGRG